MLQLPVFCFSMLFCIAHNFGVFVCLCMCMYVYMYVYMYAYVYVHSMCMCMCMCMCVCATSSFCDVLLLLACNQPYPCHLVLPTICSDFYVQPAFETVFW